MTNELDVPATHFGGLRLFEIALVLVRRDHVARFIVNANHSELRGITSLFLEP